MLTALTMNLINDRRTRSAILLISASVFVACMAWLLALQPEDPARIWRGMLINFLFFTSASAGLVVWPAIVVVAEGEWMRDLEKFTRAGIIFSVPSVIILVALWLGSGDWAPWYENERHSWWLNNNFLFLRNIILLVIFWASVLLFARNRYTARRMAAGVWLIFIYTVTFSIAGFDFIMSLHPEWHSMMMGGYFFINGLYSAVTAWAFMAVFSGRPDRRPLLDLGRLIVAFSLLTTYLMFSQLLPIWYENLPGETDRLIPLVNLAWVKVSWVILFLVYLGPLILIMSARSKVNYPYMRVITVLLLTGLWVEKWWLVSSVFENNRITIGPAEIVPALASLAVIVAALPFVLNKNAYPRVTEKI